MLTVSDIRRGRSKSPSGRERDRSRSRSRNDRGKSPPRSEHKKKSIQISIQESESDDDDRREKKSSKKYYESDSDDRRQSKKSSKKYDSDSDSDRHKKKSSKKYNESDSDDRKHSKHKSSKRRDYSESSSEDNSRHHSSRSKHDDRDKGKYAPPTQYVYAQPVAVIQDPRPAYHDTRHLSYVDTRERIEIGHTDDPSSHRTHSISTVGGQRYAEPDKYRYAEPSSKIVYKTKKDEPEYIKTYNANGEAHYVEVKPEKSKPSKQDALLSSRISSLAVGGVGGLTVASLSESNSGGRPPASPLLEAYRGTYQSISPMPSPLMIANHKHDSDLSDIELSDTSLSRSRSRKESDVSLTIISPTSTRKRVTFYDPSENAKQIAAALAGTHHAPNPKPLIAILPALSTDDILALRAEYKNHARVAGQGINMAKHIKMRVTGNFGKAAYATALGRWESEAYWANSWYQGGASRRELLIESLMGRSNSDIREIKNCFKDKRYGDDLEKCMKAELKADKFRTAILLALEERRMSESTPLDVDLIRRDTAELYRAVSGSEGGETAIISVVVARSDAHLREVLKLYERSFKRNFARDMIAKSKNLVVSLTALTLSMITPPY
jgi:hypothetical protein